MFTSFGMPKFDMHIYTSELTAKELKEAVTEYCILKDLHPHLPLLDLTMEKLPSKYNRIYVEQLEQGGLRIPFSTFFLVVIRHFGVHVSQLVPVGQGHWFSFESKIGDRAKKCFKEVTSSLKGWKKKFFLIDRRAVPEAMPWRHINTSVRDDFPDHYNKADTKRLAEIIMPLRPPLRHLLYMCGLTTACRHLELSYMIKDPNGKVLNMDDFLQLHRYGTNGLERNRGEHLIRRFAGRGNKPDPSDVKIASLKQGLRSCSAVKQDSLAEGRKLSPRNQIETYYLDIGDEKRRILLLINIQVFKKNNRVSGRGIVSCLRLDIVHKRNRCQFMLMILTRSLGGRRICGK
ncbi:hypothetical protein Tco_0173470 [Tanacetum coccineum]